MAEEYYGVNANEYGWFKEADNDYNRTVKRSTRVLSKFNEEQRKTAWQNIKTTAIVVAGVNLVEKTFSRVMGMMQRTIKKFTFEPMMDGLSEYTDQLTSFQAIIQNSSQFFDEIGGAEQVEAISAALDELNEYADLTIYRFRDMQNSFTGFVNAGLTLTDASTMSRGIASLTAYMGKGANEYSSAAYMFNQAMQQGKMQYYQWRSIEQTAGIGGEQTKKLFIQTAKALGKDAPDWEDLYNIYDSLGGEEGDQAFRDTLADDWLTGDVILEAMKVLNQEYDEATLKAKGYTKEIIDMANTSLVESQKVRTFAQFMDAVVEGIGTGWGQAFRAFFGDTTEATKFWTDLMNTVTDDIGKVMEKVQIYSDTFVEEGGRQALQDTLFNIWEIIKNIGKALGKLLPGDPGKILANFVKGAKEFTSVLAGITSVPSPELPAWLIRLIRIFTKVKDILVTIWQKAVVPIAKAIGNFASTVGDKLLSVIEAIASGLYKLVNALLDSGLVDAVKAIFDGLGESLSAEGGVVGVVVSAINSIFGSLAKIDVGGLGGTLLNFIGSMGKALDKGGISNLFSFLWTLIKSRFILSESKTIFWEIAQTAAMFNKVKANFFTIVGSVLAIVVSLHLLSAIDIGTMIKAMLKLRMLTAEMAYFAVTMAIFSTSIRKLLLILPVLFGITAVVGAITYIAFLMSRSQANYAALEIVLNFFVNFLSAVAKVLTGISAIIATIAANSVASAIAAKKAAEAAQTTGSFWKQFTTSMSTVLRTLGQSLSQIHAKLDLTLSIGDKFSTRFIALGIFFAGLSALVNYISQFYMALEFMKADRIWMITGALGTVFAAIATLSIILSRTLLSNKAPNGQTLKGKKIEMAIMVQFINAIKKVVNSITALASRAPNSIEKAGSVAVGLIGAISIMFVVLSNLKTKEIPLKTVFGLVLIVSVISRLIRSVAELKNVKSKEVIGIVGSILLLVTAFTALVLALGYIAGTGVGAGIMAAGLLALFAIMVIFKQFTKTVRTFAKDVDKLGDAAEKLTDALWAIDNINFSKFKSNFKRFLEVIEDALPRIREIAGELGNISGGLIIAGGDITIGTSSVSMPQASIVGAEAAIQATGKTTVEGDITDSNTGSVTPGLGTNLANTSSSLYNNIYNSVLGALDSLSTGIGKLIPNLLGGLFNPDNWKAAFSGFSGGDDYETHDFRGWTITDKEMYQNAEEKKSQASKDKQFLKRNKQTFILLGKEDFYYQRLEDIENRQRDADDKMSELDAKYSSVSVGDYGIDIPSASEKYSFLDDMALGGNKKTDVVNALDELKEAQRTTGASTETVTEAIKQLFGKMSIKLDGSQLGLVVNEVLGKVVTE